MQTTNKTVSQNIPFAIYYTPEHKLTFLEGSSIQVLLTNPLEGKPFTAEQITPNSKKEIKDLLKKGIAPIVTSDHHIHFNTSSSSSAASSSSSSSPTNSPLPILKQLINQIKNILLSQKEGNYPEDLICPLTLDLFTDPVITPDGHTFEREAIELHLTNSPTCPLTRKPLKKED
ncbi:U-box domain-containing protein, partial [Candidatus Neptunochlamydia vexilliferae]